MKRPAAVLLAAGTSSRFGATKQLAELGGEPLVQRALKGIPRDKVEEIIVVVGHSARAVEKAARAQEGVRFVLNPHYRAGISTSLRTGIGAVPKRATGAMFLLADQPFVDRALLRRLLKAFANDPDSIVATSFQSVVAPPVIFPRRFFREFAKLHGDQGAKPVIERHKDALVVVKVTRARRLDIDIPEDLDAARDLAQA